MNDAIFSKVAAICLDVAFNLPFTGASAGPSSTLNSAWRDDALAGVLAWNRADLP